MNSDFRILGELEILQDGDSIELGSPRQRALLARLLIGSSHMVTTDRLVEDLWEGDPPDTARHSLHVYVSRLRKMLGGDGTRLERRGTGYRLQVEPAELDASRFETLATEGRAARARRDLDRASTQLRDALGLWRGPALADFADKGFARDEAVRLNELRLATFEERVWVDLDLGRHGEVVEELRDVVAQHPFRETLWEQLMLALYRAGRQADALRVYQSARSNLAKDLGIEPGPALRQMEERILAQDRSLDLLSAATPSGTRNELPLQRTSFVGRERELSQATELLGRSRLLTLTGPPGSGKTRLALRLAAEQAGEFPHGIFFVRLAPLADPQLMAGTIARTLGLRELSGESPLDGLRAFLQERRMLLVLDNFEQILGAGAQVGELLDSAPDVKVVVTSRAPLGIAGEQELPVPPLTVPHLDGAIDVDALAGYDAVALFAARAKAIDPSFDLTPSNAATVAEITMRLDGLPLAIELAAARVKLLTPDDILARLEKRLALLTGGPTDSSDRHRTMRDAIAWSYDLLDPADQALFRRLGVFLGGFTLEAAAAVAGLPDAEALDGVDALLSRSLLYRPVDVGEARFALLEMIRDLALEELVIAGEEHETLGRHARHFLRWAQWIEPQLTTKAQHSAMAMLAQEQDNIRGALRYACTAPDPDLGLLITGCTWRYWESSGQLLEGRQWLERLLATEGGSDPARAKGLIGLAGLAYWQGDYREALTRYEAALDLYRSTGDRYDEADTLYGMSMAATLNGDPVSGERFAAEARSIFEELGVRGGIGRVAMAEAMALHGQGDHARARTLWKAALGVSREVGDHHLAITQLIALGMYAFQDGETEEALAIACEALHDAVGLDSVLLTVWMLDFAAAFAAPTHPREAARLAGAVESLRVVSGAGMVLGPVEIDDARTVAGRSLSSAELEEALEGGRAMALDEAVAYAEQLRRMVVAHLQR